MIFLLLSKRARNWTNASIPRWWQFINLILQFRFTLFWAITKQE
jgi:hypothetical protein